MEQNSFCWNPVSCLPIRPYSAPKVPSRWDLRKYVEVLFFTVCKVSYEPSSTQYVSCKSKAKARISYAKNPEIMRPLQKWRQKKTNNKSSLNIWLIGYRKWKGCNENAACLSAVSVGKASLFGYVDSYSALYNSVSNILLLSWIIKTHFIGHDFREIWWLLKEPFVCVGRLCSLTAKSVQSTALSFQSVHHIHGCHSLSLGVLGVCHSITNHVLKENFKYTTSLLIDQARDSVRGMRGPIIFQMISFCPNFTL